MARLLRPPTVQSSILHLAGYSLALVGRLRLVHVIVWAVLAATLFSATGKLRSEFYKKKIPVFGAWELLDLKDGELAVPAHLRPHQPVRIAKANRFDDRYEFLHPIGRGAEGNAAIYRDLFTGSIVVVKSFWHRSHPIMPAMPEAWSELFCHQLDVWPAEIPATLLLAGLEPAHRTTNQTHQHHAFQHGLVPTLDFFIALTPRTRLLPSWTTPTWTLVTPFIPAGDLTTLARTLHRSATPHTPATLDATFRPAFRALLSHVARLHARGYCHNDIQPANVFALAATRAWLLADLGHVRAPDHPYLRTRHWAAKGHWPDCRLDDVRRALKTYLAFLRAAAAEPAAFDAQLYAERAAWSRLYWEWLRRPRGAEALLGDEGRRYAPGRGDEEGGRERGWRGEMLAAAVTRELAGGKVGMWKAWRWWWALEGPWQRFQYERNLGDGERA